MTKKTNRFCPFALVLAPIAALAIMLPIIGGMAACEARSRVTPASVTIEKSETTTFKPDGTKVVEHKASGLATGAGSDASGEGVKNKLETTAPTLVIDKDASGSGGDADADLSAKVGGASKIALLVFSVIFLAAGAFCFVKMMFVGGEVCVGVSAALFCAWMFPAFFPLILILAVAAGGVGVVYYVQRGGTWKGVADSAVKGIHDLQRTAPEAYTKAKASVAAFVKPGSFVEKSISSIKSKLRK